MQAIRTARTLLLLGLPLCALLALSQPKAPVETAPPPAQTSADAADSAGIARAQHYIAEREYHASANGTGLQAPNRAQNLRTYFEPSGVRVHDRTAPGSPRLVGLSLAAIGRGETLTDVAPGDVAYDGARVEIRRPGLVEWYVNQEAGLEQGFTLEKRSAGDGPLVLELDIEGATARAQGEDVVFATNAGRKLSFAKLAAKDAKGRELAARFEVASAGRLRYVVEDGGAAYPVVIDPLLTAAPDTILSALASGPSAHPMFGVSVHSTGDVNGDGFADLIVGAPLYDNGETDEGAAFVFHGSASGIADGGPSTAATQLESNQSGAWFGQSVADAGDVNGDGYADVVVGAPLFDAGQTDEGAAFVFHGGASGIADGNPNTAATQLESDQASAQLGMSVAGAGDVNGGGQGDVIVGAPLFDAGETDEGAAFVFHGGASGIADGNPNTAATQLESNQANAQLGASVAAAGDVNGDGLADVIVGIPLYDSVGTDAGVALVFHGSSPSGIADGDPATASGRLDSDAPSTYLGRSVAGAGDVNGDGYADVIVGAPSTAIGGAIGAAYLFSGSTTGVGNRNPSSAATRLTGVSGSLVGFGSSVAGIGDVNGDGYADVVVTGITGFVGVIRRVAVYLGRAPGIPHGTSETADISFDHVVLSLGEPPASVSGGGDLNGDGYSDLVVGVAPPANSQSTSDDVFVYHGGAEGIRDGDPGTTRTYLQSLQSSAWLGSSVASAGDVNGDGYTDVIVGAPLYDDGLVDEGSAFVFHGGPNGVPDGNPSNASTQLVGGQAGAFFGQSVAGAGDVNNDGYADVIVGANQYDNGETDEGAAFIFHGNSFGVLTAAAYAAATRLESNQTNSAFGLSVAGVGDVNGDGFADVIVGAPFYSNPEVIEGAAFVFHGSSTGVPNGSPASAPTRLESNQSNSQFGVSVASAGDVNGDGLADVIVGAPLWSNGETDEGGAFVFHGAALGIPNGSPSTAATRIESNQAFSFLGESVASAGDVNADGRADVIVGASFYDAGESDEGAAFVFHGSTPSIPNGSPSTAATRLESNQSGGWLGLGVAGAGDVNGDGYADVIVGARGYDNGETDEGAAFVFHGSPIGVANGAPATASTQLESNQALSQFGSSLAGAGDVNGDGYADVIVGSLLYDDGQTDEGAAFVFLGNGNGDGRQVLARQVRPSNGRPVVPWTRAETTFRTQLAATHPAGRGRVKIQLEHCPAAVAFGNVACTLSTPVAWTDVSAATGPVTLTRDLGGLPSNTLRRWRARVLYAPTTGTTPTNPAHGPWRRFHAQAVEADFRTAIVGGGGGGGCGIGPELALLVPALASLRRLRRRGR